VTTWTCFICGKVVQKFSVLVYMYSSFDFSYTVNLFPSRFLNLRSGNAPFLKPPLPIKIIQTFVRRSAASKILVHSTIPKVCDREFRDLVTRLEGPHRKGSYGKHVAKAIVIENESENKKER
jgi:hypothetical protein